MRCNINSHRDDGCCRPILRIHPCDKLTFNPDGCRDPCSTITLTNNTEQCVAFKVKTTSPEKFRVRPCSGIIRPHCQCEVVVQLQPQCQGSCSTRDKFLVMAIALDNAEVSSQEMEEMWRLAPRERIFEHKLRCTIASNCPPVNNCAEQSQCCPTDTDHLKQLENLKLHVDCLQSDVCYLRRLLFVVLALLLFLLIFLFIMVKFGVDPFLVRKTIINSCIGPNIA